MTKVYDWTQDREEKKGKPIEFLLVITDDGTTEITSSKPSHFDGVALVHRAKSQSQYDIFAAWYDTSTETRYLGHWNGGYVE